MAESEDRTEAPSKLKHQQAREQGQVAHSPELTSAAALLGAVLMLGVVGEPLMAGLLGVVQGRRGDALAVSMDLDEVVAHLRASALAVLGPLAALLVAPIAAGVAAHAAQVGWLWSPGLVAPDPSRLWGIGAGRGLAARAGRGAWSLARTTAVLGVAAWAIRSRLDGLAGLSRSDGPALALAWSDALRGLLVALAGAALALGLVDLALQRQRFGTLLRLTPEEAKEDRKATDGDPAIRSRRLRMARAWRGDAPELLAGASLLVVGDGGLAVILAGGPPPGRVSVRSAADGPTGRALRRSAEAARLPVVERPALARRLSLLATKTGGPVPADGMADLAKAWPAG